MKKIEVDRFTTKKIKDAFKTRLIQQADMKEVASNFGWFLQDGIKNGLTIEEAFVAVKEHFTHFGQAMIDFAQNVDMIMGDKSEIEKAIKGAQKSGKCIDPDCPNCKGSTNEQN